MPPAPLPVRDGLNATRLRLPDDGTWPTVLAFLLARFPDDARRLREKVGGGQVVDDAGTPVTVTTPYRARTFVHLYRDPPVERRVPFDIEVLHHDDDLVVVDKPHFLATTPRGAHVVESALVRLRRELELPQLSPAHRLDRLTAGVLLLVVRPELRGAYQGLFDTRAVVKTYEAVAPVRPGLDLPCTVRSRIVKERGVLQAREVRGEPNAETHVELLTEREGTGGYRLRPRTGRTHQLRVHLSSLGVPILGDDLYPTVCEVDPHDVTGPLQLLARALELDDPLTGRRRRFVSRRTLASWPGTPRHDGG